MHTEELGTNVPAFLAKLWKMVEDPDTNDLISWSSGGTSFYIRDQARFARELLPLYYKHNNMASFVRQLNMYGFHKVVSIESGGLKLDKDEMEFAHQCFLMGHPYLLEHIKRKISVNKAEDNRSGSKPELVNKVLAEVKNMKGRQDSVDSQLSAMKRENEVLWREVAILRQKHIKQQQIVNKLIQFLVSMVQSSRGSGIGMKRHYPLMLNDITNRPSKSAKLGTEFSDLTTTVNELSPTGPVIHELDAAELLDDCDPAAEEVPNSDFLATNLCSAEIGEVRSPESPQQRGEGARLMEETGPEVLLEFDGEDYALNPEVLVQVSPAEINPTLAPKQSLKAKGKAKKHKNGKAVSNLKLKINPVKKSQPVHDLSFNEYLKANGTESFNRYFAPSESNIKQEQVEPLYCSQTSPSPCGKLVEVEEAPPLAAEQAAQITASPLKVEDALPVVSDVSLSSLAGEDVPGPVDVLDEIVGEETAAQPPEEARETAAPVVPDSSDMTLACAGVNSSQSINRCGPVEELDSHLDAMQNDLDGLKEILKGDCYSLDANTLLGLFGDDILSYGLHLSPDADLGNKSKDNDATLSGSELMAYPANLDLADMYEIEDWAPNEDPASPANEVNESDLATPNPQAANTPAPKLCQ